MLSWFVVTQKAKLMDSVCLYAVFSAGVGSANVGMSASGYVIRSKSAKSDRTGKKENRRKEGMLMCYRPAVQRDEKQRG